MPTHADICPVAKAIVQRALRIKEGEDVIVESWDHQLELAGDVVYWCRKAGARPLLMVEREEDFDRSLDLPPSKLGRVGRHEWAALEASDAYVFIPGPADPTIFDRHPGKRASAQAYNDEWYRRARRAGIRGARSLLGYVSEVRAKLYGISYQRWRDMLIEASLVDPQRTAKVATKLGRILEKSKELRITSPNGTDLTASLRYPPIRDDGLTDSRDVREGYNMTYFPGGGVWTAVEEGSVEGRAVSDHPTTMGYTFVHGMEWRLEDGKLVDYTGGKGLEAFERAFKEAGKGKEILGEVDIGLNPRMTFGTPQDPWVRGATSLYLGDNTFVGGKNSSDFSASVILEGATVKADAKTLVRAGRVQL
jgi:leucyl aminopeptidase (aminopeptidase T)